LNDRRIIPAALLVAAGLALAGWFVGHGFVGSRTAERFVTVKGLAERDVVADLALWPLAVVATDNDLTRAQKEIERSTREVIGFLARHDVDTTGVEILGLEVTDRLANRYGGDRTPSDTRFIVNQQIMVRTKDPMSVHRASQKVGELVQSGVVLLAPSGFGPARPTFIFENLNDLKPDMIAEATAGAREAAEQFAKDSGSALGGIRRANQGVFVIMARDQAPGIEETSQVHKTVRVVSTVEYFLED